MCILELTNLEKKALDYVWGSKTLANVGKCLVGGMGTIKDETVVLAMTFPRTVH